MGTTKPSLQRHFGAVGELSKSSAIIVHVVHLRLWDQARGARFYLEEESEALELVDKASRWLAAFDIAATGSVLSALRWLCAETVIRYAEVLHVGVVVVGSRRRTMASQALLGSTTYQIEKMSSLRVMVVHPA